MESTGKTVLAVLAAALAGFGATYVVTNKRAASNPTGGRRNQWSTAQSLIDPTGFDVVNKETGERKVLGETMGVAQQVEDTLNGRGDPTSEIYEWASELNPTAFDKQKYKNLTERWIAGEVKVVTWSERDRAMIGIQEVDTGEYLIEWWDEDVGQLIEGGFIKQGRGMEKSVIQYAEDLWIPAYYSARQKSGGKKTRGRRNPSPYVLRLVKDNWFVESSYPLESEPVLRVMRWRVIQLRDPYMRKQDGLELSYRGDGTYYGGNNIELSIGNGNTQAEVIFEQAIPPPKTKLEVRWKGARWEKLTKKGWV